MLVAVVATPTLVTKRGKKALPGAAINVNEGAGWAEPSARCWSRLEAISTTRDPVPPKYRVQALVGALKMT